MTRPDLTIILSRSAHAGARKYVVSSRLLLVSGLLVLIMLTSFGLSGLHYYYMWKKTGDFSDLKGEVDRVRRENASLRVASEQLSDKVSLLEVTATKLKFLSGADEDAREGVGGPSKSLSPLYSLNHRELLKRFKSLDRRRFTLSTELRRLHDIYTTRSLLLAAMPAIMPVRGYPSDRFGYRSDPFNGKRDLHPGIDIAAPYGNKVVATAGGRVTFAGRKLGYGRLVKLRHSFGMATRYGHLAAVRVKVGQHVKKGDIIGYVGSSGRATGPHLHYEVRLNNQPLDPLRFFRDASEGSS